MTPKFPPRGWPIFAIAGCVYPVAIAIAVTVHAANELLDHLYGRSR